MVAEFSVGKALTRRAAVVFGVFGALSANAAIYYVDSQFGDDTNSGTADDHAWKSLERVNAKVFEAGDEIRFKAGTHYTGQLRPQGSGKIEDGKIIPIVIGMYGDKEPTPDPSREGNGPGPKPRIDGEGKSLDTLLLRNVEFWEVQDLEITNLGTNRQPWRTGVRVVTDGFGKMRHIQLRNLFVHDVNGDLRKEREGCGIFFESRGRDQSHFDDLLIEGCHVLRADRNGICQRNGSRARSLNVVIRSNLLEDIGGDCIKVWGSNGALVEHNTVRGGRTRCEDYAAGIWPFDSDDTVIQFNEVSGMKGTKDGQGFDADYRCRRTVIQYNYSHDNDGGFILICTPGNSYNEDTIIRYNISQNDGINKARVFHFGGGAKNTLVHNNTIYVGTNQSLPLLLFGDWSGGNANGTKFFNNIFYVDGQVSYEWGKSTNTLFEHNIFYGRHSEIPPDARAITNRPPFIKPGSGGEGFDSLAGYRPAAGGGEFQRGILVAGNGGRDFFGNPLPQDKPPCIGTFEVGIQPLIR
jgi:Right handed beta helix region